MKHMNPNDPNFIYHSKSILDDLNHKKKAKKPRHPRHLIWGITALDLLLILGFFVFIVPYLSKKGTEITWNNYIWTLRNQNILGETLIILKVKANKQSSYAQQPYIVEFYNDTEPFAINPLHGILPESKEEESLRIRVSLLKGIQLRAIIHIDGSKIEITNTIIKEKNLK